MSVNLFPSPRVFVVLVKDDLAGVFGVLGHLAGVDAHGQEWGLQSEMGHKV